MSCFPEPHTHSKSKIEGELDLANYVTKSDLKNSAGVDTFEFAKKVDLVSLKPDIVKLDTDKLEKVPSGLRNLKSKVDKLDVDKLVLVAVDLSKLSDVVKNDVVERVEYDETVKKVNNIKTTDTKIWLVEYDTKTGEIEKKVLDHDEYITTQEFNKLMADNFAARLKQAKITLLIL